MLPGALALLAAAFTALGDAGRVALRFERSAIATGEAWRLLSGHLAHLGTQHLVLNIAGLLLVWYLVGKRYTRAEWLVVALTAAAGVDLGLWFLEPGLQWYVGLSGLLHGLLAAGLIAGRAQQRTESVMIGSVLAGKLLYESLIGPLPGSADAAGGPVVVSAHLYGTLGGAFAAILIRAWRWYPARGRPRIPDD